MNNEFTYYLRAVNERTEKFLDDYAALEKAYQKARKRLDAVEKVLAALPHAKDITEIADRIERAIPLFSRTEVTEIQEGLREYANALKTQLDGYIDNISAVIDQTKTQGRRT